MTTRDGHIRVLPIHVANKIAAGEVVERPASVVKELVENAIDAGAKNIKIAITQGGRKLVAVQDDGCGMCRDDAVLSLERQATSKILDVNDIEEIDTLGFRGEAIPSIASVSRFTITTRRHDSDEGTLLQVNAGQLAEVRTAGCPPGTLVEVRDLFCNVPARRKFLRAYVTEENHVKQVFTVHALAHPAIGLSLTIDGRELYRLAPAAALSDRIREIFGGDFASELLPLGHRLPDSGAQTPRRPGTVSVTGFIEKPNLSNPTRREQYIFVNGRPATSPSIAYALREAYPRRQGDVRPAVIMFIDLPPNQVDVNVHPTKREVRFRDNTAVNQAVMSAVKAAVQGDVHPGSGLPPADAAAPEIPPCQNAVLPQSAQPGMAPSPMAPHGAPVPGESPVHAAAPERPPCQDPPAPPSPAPMQVEFAVEPNSTASRPWQWFRYLAQTASGYILVETDAGLVTVNPQAARERIAFEQLNDGAAPPSQPLLIPEVVKLPPADAARVRAALGDVARLGFAAEEFGQDTFKVDAVPQIVGSVSPASVFATIARDLSEGAGPRRAGERWREEMVAKSVARAFAGMKFAADEASATKLVEDLCACRMPYVTPRGKPIMIFTSTRELNRKFARE